MGRYLSPKAIRMPSLSTCKARQRIVQLEVSKEPTLVLDGQVLDDPETVAHAKVIFGDLGSVMTLWLEGSRDDMTIIIILPQNKAPEHFTWIQHGYANFKMVISMKHGNLGNSCNASKSLCLARRVKVSLRLWRGDFPESGDVMNPRVVVLHLISYILWYLMMILVISIA